MRALPWILAGAALGLFLTARAVAKPASAADGAALWTDNVMSWIENLTQDASANERRYRPVIESAERTYGIPAGLLARLLYQESRYRTDIINGTTRSPAGAIGIAQFMPATAAELGVDPLNPISSIYGAAQYLRRLYDNFGDWKRALAAYNFGWGNVERGRTWPAETVAYVRDISADVGLA